MVVNKNFKNKEIAVIGMGVEGISSALYLSMHGAEVTILDQGNKILPEELKNKNIKLISGANYLENLDQYDLLVRSPGIKLSLLEKGLPKKSHQKITSQTKLFFDLCPCPIIGVTGTKGKGTTSSLIYEMLKREVNSAYLGGNIGRPPFDFLDKLNAQSVAMLELSSFQLQDLTKSPHIAVLLMVTQEHLDVHENVGSYVEAKRNILRFQTPDDFAILNKDYPASNESDILIEGKVFYVSRETKVQQGCFVKNGKIVVRIAEVASKNFLGPATGLSSGENFISSPQSVKEIEILGTKDILLPGRHNLENVCAAVMAAVLCGVSRENIVSVLKTFKGLEHRLELVGEINGVRYYDDSFSTTPESAIAAIEAFENPKILILGGSSKNSDFTQLGRVIENAKNIKAIIGIGEEWTRIKAEFQISNFKFQIIEGLKNMKEIVRKASDIVEPGDVVLLSPACASFGMFKDYKDRGDQFKKEVARINLDVAIPSE